MFVSDGLNEVIVYSFPDEPKKKNRGFAFLDYDSHKSAASAKKRLGSGRFRVFNCDIIVDWADPQKQPDEETMSKASMNPYPSPHFHVSCPVSSDLP